MTPSEEDQARFISTLNTITSSLAQTRHSLSSLSSSSFSAPSFDTKEGISLLTLKSHTLLSYLQSLVFITSHKTLSHSLSTSSSRTSPPQPFGAQEREPRGTQGGDAVESLVEARLVLEKVKALEGKMRYQIEKLVRLAEEGEGEGVKDIINDPLAFRPNPNNLLNPRSQSGAQHRTTDVVSNDGEASSEDEETTGGIYRPPKLVPTPYPTTTTSSSSKRTRPVAPNALSTLSSSYLPQTESSTGLGLPSTSLKSKRARELDEMRQFEEDNMTRLVMKKRDARRRVEDEADIALGGSGFSLGGGTSGKGGKRGRRGAGLEEEFDDVIRSIERGTGKKGGGDGYEALRVKGRKPGVVERAKKRVKFAKS